MGGKAKNLIDTLKNIDLEDVVKGLYWLDKKFNVSASRYAADAAQIYVQAGQTSTPCTLLTDWFAVFELNKMEKYLGYYSKDGIEWNFCDTLPGTNYTARKVSNNGSIQPLAGEGTVFTFMRNNDLIFNRGKVIGVQIWSSTNETCMENPKRNYTFTEFILCDKDNSD